MCIFSAFYCETVKPILEVVNHKAGALHLDRGWKACRPNEDSWPNPCLCVIVTSHNWTLWEGVQSHWPIMFTLAAMSSWLLNI